MNVELIREILLVSMGSSIFSTALIQKIKENQIKKFFLFYISFIVSISVGFLFALSFSNLSFVNCIWVGFITWVGADTIYKAFEDKLFSSYKSIEEVIEINRDDVGG